MDEAGTDLRVNRSEESTTVIEELNRVLRTVFNLSKDLDNSSLYLYALSLGIIKNKATPIDKVQSGGFIRESTLCGITNPIEHLFYAHGISKIIETDQKCIEKIGEKDYKKELYKQCDEYANTGFIELGERLQKQKAEFKEDKEQYLLEAINDADTLYKRYVSK